MRHLSKHQRALCKHEGLRLILKAYTQEFPGIGVCVCNPRVEEVEAGGFLGLSSHPG